MKDKFQRKEKKSDISVGVLVPSPPPVFRIVCGPVAQTVLSLFEALFTVVLLKPYLIILFSPVSAGLSWGYACATLRTSLVATDTLSSVMIFINKHHPTCPAVSCISFRTTLTTVLHSFCAKPCDRQLL